MLTGDHPATARAIAEEAGLLESGRDVLTSADIAHLANGELHEKLDRAAVIARATPLDKLRIIESFQQHGHTVAMTGGGVNGGSLFGRIRDYFGDVRAAAGPHGRVCQHCRYSTRADTSLFLVVLAQSAATSRSLTQKHNETFSANRDLVALGAANALAAVSGRFVGNGSPTKTAVVDSAGGRTQAAQLAAAAATLAVLLSATSLIARLPNAALAALVFLIGVRLVDIQSLRQIYGFRRATFAVVLATMAALLFLGVERGIFLAIVFSVLDHLRQEYHPKDVVLLRSDAQWKIARADAGAETEPGLLVYRFEAPLFFANADYFAVRVQALVKGAPHPVKVLGLDLVSMNDIDYTAALTLAETVKHLEQQGITVALVQTEDVRASLDRLGITRQVGTAHIFETVSDAVTTLTTPSLPAHTQASA